jgi:hypothetical protein
VEAINVYGDTAGYSEAYGGGPDQAMRWGPAGHATILGTPSGTIFSIALGINKLNESVGTFESSGAYNAVCWNSAGSPTVLTSLGVDNLNGGATDDQALRVNNEGDIAGTSNNEAVVWDSVGNVIWHGADGTYIDALNPTGYTVGAVDNNPALWNPTGGETLLQIPAGVAEGRAFDINAKGQSCGAVTDVGASVSDAVLWDSSGHATVLQDPGVYAAADAINNSGQTVGWYQNSASPSSPLIAVMWRKSGAVTNLQDLLGTGWSNTIADGINNVGDIVGYGDFNGLQESFELIHSPVTGTLEPSPQTLTATHEVLAPAPGINRPWLSRSFDR